MHIHVVDDDNVSRRSVGMILQRLGHRVRYFSSGVTFIATSDLEPGCVILDLCMPEMSGIDTLAALRERREEMPVVVVTGVNDVASVVKAMKLGAIDVLMKPVSTDALVTAVQEGETVLKTGARRHDIAKHAQARLECLTRRERDVLAGMAKGYANKTIGYDLGISSRTVEIHRAHLMSKLGVRSLSELLQIVYDSKLDSTTAGD